MIVLTAAALAPTAQAKVELRAGTATACVGSRNNADIDSTVLPRPANTADTDLLVATITVEEPPGAISSTGWTEVQQSHVSGVRTTATFVRFAGSGAGPYTWTHANSDATVGSIAAFSGVSTTAPVATGSVKASSSGSPYTLPNATSTTWGAMRYSAVSSSVDTTAVFQADLAEICDGSQLALSLATAYERVNSGTTPNRTVTRSGSGALDAHTLVLQPANACGGGTLTLAEPASFVFPTTTLTGYDQTLPATATVRVNDQRGSGAGWNLSATSTTFQSGARLLSNTATTIVSVGKADVAGICESPSNSVVSYPMTLPAGQPAPTAAKLYNAAVNTGLGPVDLTLNTQLAVPSRTAAGTYTSTWTFTLATGP